MIENICMKRWIM